MFPHGEKQLTVHISDYVVIWKLRQVSRAVAVVRRVKNGLVVAAAVPGVSWSRKFRAPTVGCLSVSSPYCQAGGRPLSLYGAHVLIPGSR